MGRTTVRISEQMLLHALELKGAFEIKDARWEGPGGLELTLEGATVPDVDECDIIYTRVPEHVKMRFEPR